MDMETKVKDLIEQLQSYPENALVHVYEGEVTGVVVSVKEQRDDGKTHPKEIGFISVDGG